MKHRRAPKRRRLRPARAATSSVRARPGSRVRTSASARPSTHALPSARSRPATQQRSGAHERTGAQPTVRHRRARRRRGRFSGAGELALIAVVVLLVGLFVRTFLVTPFSIPSGSMEDTLQVGDRILVDRASYRVRDVHRGEVVVFDGSDTFGAIGQEPSRGPIGSLVHSVAASVGLAQPAETDYVKRVIGVGGDRVACCDGQGRITVNGRPVDERAYLHPGDKPSDLRFDIEVPPGRLWVMGDHRSNSRDSRAHLGDPGTGTIPVDDVIGRVVGVIWPFSRLGGVP